MTFFEAVRACLAKYASFNGRATRTEYWWFFLAVVLGSAAAWTISPKVCSLFALATLLPIRRPERHCRQHTRKGRVQGRLQHR